MTDFTLTDRSYRYVDTGTKLAGVALLAGAFELGIASAPGAALALAGALFGVSTVFVTKEPR